MSRSQSGALPSVVSITSNKKQRAVDSIIGFDDDEDESAEFDADADYSKDEGTYMSSHSDKLSEVERKLAEMERENNDFVELRLKDESKGKVVNKNMDISAVSNGDGDYSEEDFESGSDNEIEIGDESVASEDIDAMELSVGGAGSDSDGSFNGLNSEISKKKSTPVPNKDVGNWGSKAALTKNVITQKSTILKEDSDGSEFSHSGSDSADMEFSTNDIEMSSSRGIESDAGYDFTAKPIAVVTTRGPRDRTSGW